MNPSRTATAIEADRAAALRLTPSQVELLAVIATDDHDTLAAHLRDRAVWWRTLRVLERNHLVTVAMVGPQVTPWPWIHTAITPTGTAYLTRHQETHP